MQNQTIATLASELGSESVVELVDAYLADTPDRLHEIAQLIGTHDQASLRRAAHSLKGSSSIFGVDDMEKAALELEMAAANGDRANQSVLYGRLVELFPKVQATLHQAISELHASAA
jgi:HPt (histidine-containing phosphotransfer) domain-containing protein